jgi:hypothetical protein
MVENKKVSVKHTLNPPVLMRGRFFFRYHIPKYAFSRLLGEKPKQNDFSSFPEKYRRTRRSYWNIGYCNRRAERHDRL